MSQISRMIQRNAKVNWCRGRYTNGQIKILISSSRLTRLREGLAH